MQRDCLPFRTQAGTKHEQVPCPQGGGVRANSFRAGRSYSARFHCGLPWFLPCSLDTATCSSSGGRPANGSQPECHVLVGNTLRTAKAISTPAFRHGCRAWCPPVPWYSVEQLEADGLHFPPQEGTRCLQQQLAIPTPSTLNGSSPTLWALCWAGTLRGAGLGLGRNAGGASAY